MCWTWNVRAKVLSHLTGVSGKCSDSCVGRHVGSSACERTFRVLCHFAWFCLTHNMDSTLAHTHTWDCDLVYVPGTPLKTQLKLWSTASGRLQLDMKEGFGALHGNTWRSATMILARLYNASVGCAVSSCVGHPFQ